MNNEFKRMQKLAGILTEGYQGTDYESSEDMALDMVKTGAGLPGGLPETKKKMTKMEAKKMIKDAILAEMEGSSAGHDFLAEKKKAKADKEEEVPEEELDVDLDMDVDMEDAGESSIDMDMNDTPDLDVSSQEAKDTFDDLAKAYQAAKQLGDEKLIQQLANTITYFNKNIILK